MAKISKEDLDEIDHDMVMLSRVAKYELTEKHMKFVRHLNYENTHVRGRHDIKTWFSE